MPRLVRVTITLATVTATFAALVAAFVGPAGDDFQALAQHRLIAAAFLVLAVLSAMVLGIAIGRDRSGDTRPTMANTSEAPLAADQTQAETMARAETEFLANISHELRTPLNAVIGFAGLILSEVYGPLGDRRYVDYLSHIHSGGEQLLAIVDAILDLSQLASGQLGLQLRDVQPRSIVEDCARLVSAQAEAAEVELVVRPSTARTVAADPARLRQALLNLLSNAIKFTEQGGRVSIGATSEDSTVVFKVTDTGIGMTPDQVTAALQPFRMIEGSLTRRHGGVGLGLPLAMRLVRLHGGDLRIDSHPGCGTAVAAILPARTSCPAGET